MSRPATTELSAQLLQKRELDADSSLVRRMWALVRADPAAWFIACGYWLAFWCAPLATGAAVKLVFDRVDHSRAHLSVGAALAVLAACEALRWTTFPLGVRQWHGAFAGWQARIRANLLRSLALGPEPPRDRLPATSGATVSRFRDDVEDVSYVLDVWLDAIGSGTAAAIAVGALVAIDARIAIGVVVPVGLMVVANQAFGNRVNVWRAHAREATAGVTGFLGEVFSSVLTLKTAGAEEAALARLHELNVRRRPHAARDQVAIPFVEGIAETTGEVAVGIVLLLVAGRMRSGGFTLGDLSLFASYIFVLATFTRWMGRLLTRQRQGATALARLTVVTGDEAAVVATAPLPIRHMPPPLPAVARAPSDRLDTLTVSGLGYRHPSSGRGVEGIDLDIRRGEVVVITGPVGSGKTTLVRALLGLLPGVEGEVRWNGEVVDPATFLVPPRAAYTPQSPALFSESLAANILLGAYGDENEAAALACLDADLARMANGMATRVGPRGVRLSGGQAQRTALARMLVRRPELAVVDDVSSALDVTTEAAVWERLLGGVLGTAIVVSHRPLLLARADQVVVLENGHAARDGYAPR